MASSTLEIKLLALVEGLKDIAALGDQIVKTAKQSEAMKPAGEAFKKFGDEAKGAVLGLDQAFSTLGGKSTQAIKAEIEGINQALQKVQQSGAGFEEIARASAMADAKLKVLNNELKNPAPKSFSESLESIKSKLNTLDFKGAASEAGKLSTSFTQVLEVIKPLALAFLGLAGLKSLGALVKDSADLAAKVETLGVTMKVVGRNAGYSAEELDKSEKTLKKLGITTEVARESLTKMIQAGIRVNDLGDSLDETGKRMTKAQELARAAQDLAVVTGENSSDTLQRLVTNIQQMDTMGLRFMGLTVSREAAEAKFAAAVGKTTDALSESERQQAFYNATVTEARKLSGAYVDALDTVSKKLGSLKRYQDEFILSIGNNFVPAYGALVDAVTDYLREGQKLADHFEKTSSTAGSLQGGVKALSESFGATLLNSTPGALAAMEAFSRAFKVLGELLGPVIQGLGEFIPPVLMLLTGFFDGVALIAAVIKDVVMIAFGMFAEGLGVITLAFSGLITGISKVVGVFNTGLSRALYETGESLKEAGKNMIGFGSDAIDTAESSKGAVGQLATSFSEVANESGKTKEKVREFSTEISDLVKAQANGSISAEDLNTKYEALTDRLINAAQAGDITKKEFVDLGKQLQAVPGTLAKSFEEAASSAQTSFSTITTSISKESAAGAAFMDAAIKMAATKSKYMFEAMGVDASKFGEAILAAYDKYAKGAKSVEDLIVVNKQLEEARAKGLITEEQFQEKLKLSTKRFEEIFTAAVKAASTDQDFDRLRGAVNEMGKTGELSGTQVAVALKKIEDAAIGATGKIKELADAQSRLTIADASLAAAQAHFNMVKAETDVMKERVGLWKAENDLARDGSRINQLGVESARLALQLAQEELILARLQYKEQIENLNLVIAKQRESNATKQLYNDGNNEALQKEQLAARELATAYELGVTKIKEQVDAQRENVLKIQEVKLEVDAEHEALKLVTEELKSNTKGSDDHSASQEKARGIVQGLKGDVVSVSTAMGGVKTAQDSVSSGYGDMTTASSNWASAAVASAVRVAQANADAVAAGVRADATGQFTPGSGSITNAETGKTTNLPKDTGVTPSAGKTKAPLKPGMSGYTGAGWSNGATPTNSQNGGPSAGQVKDAQEYLANDAKRYKLAADGGNNDSVLTKNNMAPVDNKGPFVAWEKYSSGELTEADAALVKAVYKSAKSNYTMGRSHMNGISTEGLMDDLMWLNRSVTMMEKLKLPALATGTNYVPKDMLAQIHEGEAVVPKRYNPAAGGGGMQAGAGDWSGLGSVLSGGAASIAGAVQSIAAPGKTGAEITKKIEVELRGPGARVTATIDAADEPALLTMLAQLKGRS